jgi:23S rRNA pseudouridine1911/1915/1917 synthase
MAKDAQTICWVVDDAHDGDRLDRFLAAMPECHLAAVSRERLKALIQQGQVQVNHQVILKPAFGLSEMDEVRLCLPPDSPLDLVAEDIPLDVVYEDAVLLVVHKPRGMLTHPAGTQRSGTLVNALLFHCRDAQGQSTLSGINGVIRPGIVHRLDKDTSGLLVVAKTDAAHLALSQQLQPADPQGQGVKRMQRTYVALVQGVPTQERGVVDAPIGRDPGHREKMRVVAEQGTGVGGSSRSVSGRFARTHWTIEATGSQSYCLLRLQLDTGRTHQIRVHLASIGHPIVGDPLYGTGVDKLLKLAPLGQRLQAVAIAFDHPDDGRPMAFSIPLEPLIQADWARLQ